MSNDSQSPQARCRRRRRRRLRRPARLHDRGLPGLQARADRDLRQEHQPGPTYQQFAWNLGQTVLRSESESHFLPADWPTFAQLDACAAPRPRAAASLGGAQVQPRRARDPHRGHARRASGSATRAASSAARRVGWIVREPGPPPHFSLYDEDAKLLGRAKHLMVADRPRPAGLPRRLRQGAREPGDRATASCRPTSPSSTTRGGRYIVRRLGDRLGQRVGERDRGRRAVHRPAAQPAPRRAGPERAALPLRRQRHRRVPGPLVRPAARLPRPGAARHRAERGAPGRTRSQQAREAGRFEEVDRRRHRDPAGPGRPARARCKLHRRAEDVRRSTSPASCAAPASSSRRCRCRCCAGSRRRYDVPIHRERIRLKTNCGVPAARPRGLAPVR